MFHNRFLKFLIIVIAGLLILSACTPAPTSQAVEVPEAINLAIGSLVLALLTAGFVYVLEALKLDLRGFALPLSVAISAYLVAQLQGLINTIPAQFDPLLSVVLQIIVVIIGGMGLLRLRAGEPARLI